MRDAKSDSSPENGFCVPIACASLQLDATGVPYAGRTLTADEVATRVPRRATFLHDTCLFGPLEKRSQEQTLG